MFPQVNLHVLCGVQTPDISEQASHGTASRREEVDDDGRYLCPLHKTWQLVYFAGVYRSTGLREGKKLKSPEKQKVKKLLWKSKMPPD